MAIEPARKPKHQPEEPKTESWRDWVIDISSLWADGYPEPKTLPEIREAKRPMTEEEMEAFWKKCDENAGPGREPDWEEHLKNMNETRYRSIPDV